LIESAVQINHCSVLGSLMQAVDILGHQSSHLTGPF
jgi:hypothetical protein